MNKGTSTRKFKSDRLVTKCLHAMLGVTQRNEQKNFSKAKTYLKASGQYSP